MKLNELRDKIHENAKAKGFYKDEMFTCNAVKNNTHRDDKEVKHAFFAQKIALIHSELSEALESDRENFHAKLERVLNLKPEHGRELKPRYKVGGIAYIADPYRIDDVGHDTGITIEYSDGEIKTFSLPAGCSAWIDKRLKEMSKSKSGFCNKMFMPEWCARDFIRITDVKAERLQEISEEDCFKEGIYLDYIDISFFHYHDQEDRHYCSECEEKGRERLLKEVLEDRDRFGFEGMNDEWIMEELDGYSAYYFTETAKYCDICGKALSAFKYPGCEDAFCCPSEAYAAEIDMINGKGTWDSNPWMWSYYYELVKK
jgi:hypothetical protein